MDRSWAALRRAFSGYSPLTKTQNEGCGELVRFRGASPAEAGWSCGCREQWEVWLPGAAEGTKSSSCPWLGWAAARGELLTQHRMSVGWEGGFLEKNFEHFCRKKLCKQLCLISVPAQMWALVVCKVCSRRGQQGNSSVMDTGDVLLLYRKKIWTGQDISELPVEWTLSTAWPQPVVASVTINVCILCSQ